MNIQDIPVEGWVWAVVIVLALLNVYNTIMTARKNARDEKNIKESTTTLLSQRVDAHEEWLKNDKRRIDELERRLDDYQQGMMANCRGVMALIEYQKRHSTDEDYNALDAASENIKNYLTDWRH